MRRLLFVLVICALSSASAALAQMNASRIPERPAAAEVPNDSSLSDVDRARVMMRRFATCIVQKSREHVLSVLKNYNGPLGDLADSDCLGDGTLQMPLELFRGALFAALYSNDFRSDPKITFPDPPLTFSDCDSCADVAAYQSYVALRHFADCVVRAAPAESRTLALARPASAEEKRAFFALEPHLSACLQKGTTISFSRSVLAGLIAEVLYRDTVAANDAPGATPKLTETK